MNDLELRSHILQALEWEPRVDAADIGVTADGGVVTLRGSVKSLLEREAAERAALQVYGVRAIANDLEVRLAQGAERTDTDIARAALDALTWTVGVPEDGITVSVHDGHIVLKGAVDWQAQKEAAERAVGDLAGVRALTNDIIVEPRVTAEDVQKKIEVAFHRSAEIDARRIKVSVHGHTVTLTGNVQSWAERQAAERAAWAAPGISLVEDHLAVVP